MNKKRLLDVARACREAPDPSKFTMAGYANRCGSPACALGHYAVRTDLQDKFSLRKSTEYGLPWIWFGEEPTGFDTREVCDWFDITRGQCRELFSDYGCGGDEDEPITDPVQVAEYIENFVKRHESC
jgi:hypothetical protein